MKLNKRVLSLIMAVVMVLSLCTVAFAADTATTALAQPTSSTAIDTLTNISSVTVNGTSATYCYDSNTGSGTRGTIYIRATVSGTEYDLQTATVVITTTGSEPTVKLDGTTISKTSSSGNAYTYSLNMLNKAYTVTVDSNSYTLAAGLTKTTDSALPTTDPLRIDAMTIGGATGTITTTVIQNPYMGNPYYSMWTSASYKVKAAMSGTQTRGDLDAAITIPTGATVTNTGCSKNTVVGNGASQSFKLDLTSNTILTVTYGDYSRNYYIVSTDAINISVKVGIDFTEALASDAYNSTTSTDVKDRVDTLIRQCKIFFGNKGVETTDAETLAKLPTHGEITVPAGTTAMGVMRMFAEKYHYESEVPENCTYMAKLNGVGEFTFGSYSGWMYSDNPTWDTETGAALYTTWRTPAVGGADYVLTQNSNICWFICCNYMHHPWH